MPVLEFDLAHVVKSQRGVLGVKRIGSGGLQGTFGVSVKKFDSLALPAISFFCDR